MESGVPAVRARGEMVAQAAVLSDSWEQLWRWVEKQGLVCRRPCAQRAAARPSPRASPGACRPGAPLLCRLTWGPAALTQARHPPPRSGVRKGPCGLAGSLGREQRYRPNSAGPRALCAASGLAPSAGIRLRCCAGHQGLPQSWPQAPRLAGPGALRREPRGTWPYRPPRARPSAPPGPSAESLRMRPVRSQRDPRRAPGGDGEPALLFVHTAITQEAAQPHWFGPGGGKAAAGLTPLPVPQIESSPPESSAHARSHHRGGGAPSAARFLVGRQGARAGGELRMSAARCVPARSGARGGRGHVTRRGGGFSVRPAVPAARCSASSRLSASRLRAAASTGLRSAPPRRESAPALRT